MIQTLEDALVTYIQVLSASADETHRSEDRPRYQSHLAEAARMFVALRADVSLQELKTIVARERHNFGWSYLSDEVGERAEAAFTKFASLVELL